MLTAWELIENMTAREAIDAPIKLNMTGLLWRFFF